MEADASEGGSGGGGGGGSAGDPVEVTFSAIQKLVQEESDIREVVRVCVIVRV